MDDIIDFFKNNYLNIGIIIFIVIVLLVIISLMGINFNTPLPPTHLVQSVTFETFEPNLDENMDDLNMSVEQSFCSSLDSNSADLEKSCNELTKENCAEVGCCVYMRDRLNGKCVAGYNSGPTYKTDKDGNLITTDRYYYLGKCFGNCPPSM